MRPKPALGPRRCPRRERAAAPVVRAGCDEEGVCPAPPVRHGTVTTRTGIQAGTTERFDDAGTFTGLRAAVRPGGGSYSASRAGRAAHLGDAGGARRARDAQCQSGRLEGRRARDTERKPFSSLQRRLAARQPGDRRHPRLREAAGNTGIRHRPPPAGTTATWIDDKRRTRSDTPQRRYPARHDERPLMAGHR